MVIMSSHRVDIECTECHENSTYTAAWQAIGDHPDEIRLCKNCLEEALRELNRVAGAYSKAKGD